MTAIVFLIGCLVLGSARASVVELNCSDNATCIDFMAKEFVRSLRQQKTVRVFDLVTIEPVATRGMRQARSSQGWLSRFMETHALSFDWNDWSFRLTKPEERSGVVDLEVYESRTAKDVSEQVPKKSNSKVEEEADKAPKRRIGLKRRQKKKVLQAVIPLVFGMKSAGAVIFSMAMVTALTLKAFVASKLALMVTVGMAMKRLYETYGQGIPETSNVLWNIASFFKGLFGLPGYSPLSQPSMPMPMYIMPNPMEMYGQNGVMPEMQPMHNMAMG